MASEYDLSIMFTGHKHENKWMSEVPRIWFNMGIKDASKAAKLSIAHGRGNLKFRTKRYSRTRSLRCDLKPRCRDAYAMQLPRFGDVTCSIPEEIVNGTHEPRSYEFVDVTKRPNTPVEKKEYILYISCKIEPPTAAAAPKQSMLVRSIDRGIVEPTVVVTYDSQKGRVIHAESLNTAAPFKKNRRWHERMQKKYQR